MIIRLYSFESYHIIHLFHFIFKISTCLYYFLLEIIKKSSKFNSNPQITVEDVQDMAAEVAAAVDAMAEAEAAKAAEVVEAAVAAAVVITPIKTGAIATEIISMTTR